MHHSNLIAKSEVSCAISWTSKCFSCLLRSRGSSSQIPPYHIGTELFFKVASKFLSFYGFINLLKNVKCKTKNGSPSKNSWNHTWIKKSKCDFRQNSSSIGNGEHVNLERLQKMQKEFTACVRLGKHPPLLKYNAHVTGRFALNCVMEFIHRVFFVLFRKCVICTLKACREYFLNTDY